MDLQFASLPGWQILTGTAVGAFAFRCGIARQRREPDAQTPERQQAGGCLMTFALLVAAGLGLAVFYRYGSWPAAATLGLAVTLGPVFSWLLGTPWSNLDPMVGASRRDSAYMPARRFEREREQSGGCQVCGRHWRTASPVVGVVRMSDLRDGSAAPADRCTRCGAVFCTGCAYEGATCKCGSTDFKTVFLAFPTR